MNGLTLPYNYIYGGSQRINKNDSTSALLSIEGFQSVAITTLAHGLARKFKILKGECLAIACPNPSDNEISDAKKVCSNTIMICSKCIDTLRKNKKVIINNKENITNMQTVIIRIEGHLFDSGLINQLFDCIECESGDYEIIELISRVNTRELKKTSRLILQINLIETKIEYVINKLKTLINMIPKSEAILTELPFGAIKKLKIYITINKKYITISIK